MKKYNLSEGYEPEILDKLHRVQVEILTDFSCACEKHKLTYFAVYGTALGAVRHQGFIPWDDDVDVAMLREDYNKFFEVFKQELSDKYDLVTPEIDGRYACTVTHLQRKGTRFVSEVTKDLKCNQCIDLDIFPFDYVAVDKRARKKQALKTTFYGKLLFLAGTPHPIIPYSGVVGALMGMMCGFIHYVLRVLRISPRTIYRKFVKCATKYNENHGEYVTSFESVYALKEAVRVKEIYPVKSIPFENIEICVPGNVHKVLTREYGDYMKLPPESERVNHMPYIIQFEGEKPIYSPKIKKDNING